MLRIVKPIIGMDVRAPKLRSGEYIPKVPYLGKGALGLALNELTAENCYTMP
jgi:hypothetical protein